MTTKEPPDNSYEAYKKNGLVINQIRDQFVTRIQRVYDRYALQAHQQLAIADDLYDYFSHRFGLQLQIRNLYDFGYTIADHWNRKGFYIFVIKDHILIKTRWVQYRKDIGTMMHKYRQFDLIVYYPKSERFRYYLQRRMKWSPEWEEMGFFQRVSEEAFKGKSRKYSYERFK